MTPLSDEGREPVHTDRSPVFGEPVAVGLLERLEAGIRVADVGCGTGHCITLMARRFPKSTFVGYDFSEDGIAEARAAARGLTNASFVVQDVSRLEAPAPFDEDLVSGIDQDVRDRWVSEQHLERTKTKQLVDNVVDVRREIDAIGQQVRTLAQTRQRRRKDTMSLRGEAVRHALPTPAAMAGTMHQDEGRRLAPLRTACRERDTGD